MLKVSFSCFLRLLLLVLQMMSSFFLFRPLVALRLLSAGSLGPYHRTLPTRDHFPVGSIRTQSGPNPVSIRDQSGINSYI